MYDLIIFDCDGVLIESEILANQVEVATLNRLGADLTVPEYIEATLGRTYGEIGRIIREEWKIALPDDFWEKIEEEEKQIFEQELMPVAGIHQALKELKQKKCVASSSSFERLHHTLSLTKLWSYFYPSVFHCGCVKRSKPYPDLFLHAAEQMKVEPKRTLVIEDSEAGVLAAVAAGMTVFAFRGAEHIPYAPKTNFEALGADRVFTQMSDLPSLIA